MAPRISPQDSYPPPPPLFLEPVEATLLIDIIDKQLLAFCLDVL